MKRLKVRSEVIKLLDKKGLYNELIHDDIEFLTDTIYEYTQVPGVNQDKVLKESLETLSKNLNDKFRNLHFI